ncbi:MAG: proton-conducting transporter membrane subunit, partial [Streptosporangiaceae bacterium]
SIRLRAHGSSAGTLRPGRLPRPPPRAAACAGRGPASLQGAINFAVTNSLGGMSVLMGVALLYARTGSLNLAQIGQALTGRHADGLIVVAFALLTGGFLVKAAVVPFHFWLPDAYGSAPTPVCVLFAGVMSELGLFAVIRVWDTVFSGLAGGSGPRMRAVLLGFGILTAVVGAVMALAQIGQALAGRHADGLIVVAFALLAGGFLVKAAVVPFHFWLPDAYGSAPIPVCVLFAGVMSELGLFALIRVWDTVFSGLAGGSGPRMRAVLLGFGILTAVVGAVMALAQIHLKRMLAFVTMSHLGIYLIGVGLLTPLGLAGASLLVIGDGLAKSALFLGVGVLQHQRASVSEIKLRGRGRGLAVTGVTIVLGALVLADLPPFVSSVGHALLVDAADQAGLPWMEIVIALSVILSSGAVLRAAGRIWLGWGDTRSSRPDTGTADDPGEESEDRGQDGREWSGRLTRVPLTMVLPPLALLAIGLGLGLTSGLEEHAAAAATAFSDRAAYAAAVLGTHGGSMPTGGRVVVPASPAVSAGGALTDLGQALAALCVAGIALERRAVGLRRALAAGTGWLRRLHSGLVGDQVTWLTAGLALLAALGEAALH